jgi:DNA-binding CsgD family transcriptional regulator
VEAPTRRAKIVGAESERWVALLAECIDSIGGEDFPQALADALGSLVEIDYCVVFAYYQSEKPLCLFHSFSPEKRVLHVDEYVKGPYLLDPFFKACSRKIDTGLYRLRDVAPDRFYQSEYHRSYYVQTGLSEEICFTLYLPQGVAVVISLMRSGESTRFSARELRLLKSVTPIVVSLAQRHWHDVPERFDLEAVVSEPRETRSLIENTVSGLFSGRITPRETQVVAQVLEGHSSDSIARSLGITVGTVRIHRRNIYAKLRISSQQELFSMFFKRITASGWERHSPAD